MDKQVYDSLTNSQHWSNQLFNVLKEQQISLVSYVPDAGHRRLIELCQQDKDIKTVPLTTEEEGVALAAGAYLGGMKTVLLMQSSGVGNCVNMFSLLKTCQFPFLTLVTMRGEWGEFNPWQIPMGQSTPNVLTASGLFVMRISEESRVADTVAAAAKMAFSTYTSVAVLFSQEMLGAKSFERK